MDSSLGLAEARQIAEQAVTDAGRLALRISVAVADEAGALLALARIAVAGGGRAESLSAGSALDLRGFVEQSRGAVPGVLPEPRPEPLTEPVVCLAAQRARHGFCRQAAACRSRAWAVAPHAISARRVGYPRTQPYRRLR